MLLAKILNKIVLFLVFFSVAFCCGNNFFWCESWDCSRKIHWIGWNGFCNGSNLHSLWISIIMITMRKTVKHCQRLPCGLCTPLKMESWCWHQNMHELLISLIIGNCFGANRIQCVCLYYIYSTPFLHHFVPLSFYYFIFSQAAIVKPFLNRKTVILRSLSFRN